MHTTYRYSPGISIKIKATPKQRKRRKRGLQKYILYDQYTLTVTQLLIKPTNRANTNKYVNHHPQQQQQQTIMDLHRKPQWENGKYSHGLISQAFNRWHRWLHGLGGCQQVALAHWRQDWWLDQNSRCSAPFQAGSRRKLALSLMYCLHLEIRSQTHEWLTGIREEHPSIFHVQLMEVDFPCLWGFGANVWPFVPCLHFFKVEIRSCTLIPLFMPGSVYSGSVSWDGCGLPDKCVWAHFRIGSHTMPGQRHSQPTPTSLGPGCMHV